MFVFSCLSSPLSVFVENCHRPCREITLLYLEGGALAASLSITPSVICFAIFLA
jgi:hypothetical protein